MKSLFGNTTNSNVGFFDNSQPTVLDVYNENYNRVSAQLNAESALSWKKNAEYWKNRCERGEA